MKKYLFVTLLFVVLVSKVAWGGISHITFDPPTLPDGSAMIDSWTEQGVLFTGPNGVSHCDSASMWGLEPYNGTAFLDFGAGPLQTMAFKYTDSKPFDLYSVDLAEYSIYYDEPMDITFIGHKNDGSTVTQVFTLDGIIDSSGPLDDFETFTFGDNFTNLSYVEVPTVAYSLDNVYLSPVPEPSTIMFVFSSITFLRIRNQKVS